MKTSPPPSVDCARALVASVCTGSLVACLSTGQVQAENTADYFTGASDGSLLVSGNWSLGVPGVGHDAVFNQKPGTRALSANHVTVGSLNVTAATGTYSIQNQTTTATSRNLTLGGLGNLGNSISGTVADLLYVASGSTFKIRGDNTSGVGVLHLVLGQSGNFNIAGTAEISSILSDGGRHFGMTKTGAGKLTLSGVNIYDGDTTVNAGTLELASNAGLRFSVTDSSANHLAVTGTGTVNLNGSFTIDTSAVTVATGSWTLVDFPAQYHPFGTTFSVAGADGPAVEGVWTKTDGTRTWTFTEKSGVLALTRTGLTAYDAWASTTCGLSVADAGFDFDYDHDGIPNGLEWILGGDPTRNDAGLILPVVTGGAPNGLTIVFARSAATLAETELAVEWGGDPGALSNSISVGATGIGPDGDAPTVTLDAPLAGWVTVHIPGANAGAGRLFARLKATRK